MSARTDHGVETILTATPGHEIRRRRDWVEPPAEGEHLLRHDQAGED